MHSMLLKLLLGATGFIRRVGLQKNQTSRLLAKHGPSPQSSFGIAFNGERSKVKKKKSVAT